MFSEGLEFALQFVGVQHEHNGCTSAELSEFVCEDLLPFLDWSANPTLRDTLLRLLICEHGELIRVYEMPSSVAATATAAGSSGGTSSISKKAVNIKKQATLFPSTLSTGTTKAASTITQSPTPSPPLLTSEEVLRRLDAGEVSWTHPQSGASQTTSSSSSLNSCTSSKDGAKLLRLCPSVALIERTYGFSISSQSLRLSITHIARNAIDGWTASGAVKQDYQGGKAYYFTCGLRELRKQGCVSLCYLMDRSSGSCEVLYRYFPSFAMPLTEVEKAEAAAEEARRRQTEDTAIIVGTSSMRRDVRANQPLNHYYARKRRLSGTFPAVVFDLSLAKFVVKTSPDRKLLMQDAIHAILAAHNVLDMPWVNFTKADKVRLRRLMWSAGLRVVVAAIELRGRRREVLLVIPVEDLLTRLQQYRDRLRLNRAGGGETSPTSVKIEQQQHRSDDWDDADGQRGVDNTLESAQRFDTGTMVLREDTGGEEDGDGDSQPDDSDSGADDGAEEEDADTSRPGQKRQAEKRSRERPTKRLATQRLVDIAMSPFFVSSDIPFDAQVALTAERRPVALMAVMPPVGYSAKIMCARRDSIALYMQHYVEQRQTLTVDRVLVKNSTAFTLLYMPGTQVEAAEMPAVKLEAPLSSFSDAANVLGFSPSAAATSAVTAINEQMCVTASSTTKAEELAASSSVRDGDAAAAASATQAEKSLRGNGISSYSINLILDALQAAPHHALSMTQLSKLIDVGALKKRVLPYMRKEGKIKTTGVAVSGGGRRVTREGIVTLSGITLSEETKLEIVRKDTNKGTSTAGEEGGSGGADEKSAPLTIKAMMESMAARRKKNDHSQAIPTTIVLTSVPAMVEGTARSATGQSLVKVAAGRTRQTVNRVVSVRNGYARHYLHRAGRLHLELWQQWYTRVQELRSAGKAPLANEETDDTVCVLHTNLALCVHDVLECMSLSTFCIIIGLPTADLASIVESYTAENDTGTSADAQSLVLEKERRAAASTVAWDMQLRHLPPSLQAWCRSQGHQTLRHSLATLQERQLITSETTFTPFADTPLTETQLQLVPYCFPDVHHRLILHGPRYTPGSTLYMALRYWRAAWSAVTQSMVAQVDVLFDANPNPSVPCLLALQKVLRVDLSLLAEALYQRCGRSNRVEYRSTQRTSAAAAARARARRSSTRNSATRAIAECSQGDIFKRPTRRRKYSRVEVSGSSLADAVEKALCSGAGSRRVPEVLRDVDRTRRTHLSLHALGSLSPAVKPGARLSASSKALGADSLQVEPDGKSEFDMAAWQQGGVTYNHLTSRSVMHAAVLGNVMRQVALLKVSHPSGSSENRNVLPVLSFTDRLSRIAKTTFAPDLTAPNTAGDVDKAAVSARLKCIGVSFAPAKDGTPTGGSTAAAAAPGVVETSETSSHESAVAVREREGQLLELAMDVLRMVLLTDKAHYNGATAARLLREFPAHIPMRARAALTPLTAFCKGSVGQRGRVPRLFLRTSVGFVLPGLTRPAPRQCANALLAHQWTCMADEEAMAASTGPASQLVIGPLLRLQAEDFEVTLVSQPSIDLTTTAATESSSPTGMGPEDSIAQLRLPSLSWPAVAHAAERSRAAEAQEEATAAAEVREGLARPNRKRTRAEDESDEATGRDMPDDENNEDEDADEDEQVATAYGSGQRFIAKAEALYPARTLATADSLPELSSLPTDPPAGDGTVRNVEDGLKYIAALTNDCAADGIAKAVERHRVLASEAECPVKYPSIFHHVDGTFHTYVWKSFLTCLYRYVLRVPAISHDDLRRRMTTTGLVSNRCFEGALEFLVRCGVFRRFGTAMPTNSSYCCRKGEGEGGTTSSSRPFSWRCSAPAVQESVSYTATVHSGGLWDMLHLDGPVPGM